MKKNIVYLLLFGVSIMLMTGLSDCKKRVIIEGALINKAHKIEDIVSLFSLTPADIAAQSIKYIQEAKKSIDDIINISDDQRTFANTAKALDNILSLSNVAIARQIYEAFELLSPDDAIRKASHVAHTAVKQFFIEHIRSNKALYRAFNAYSQGNALNEPLSDQQRYFLADVEQTFIQEGLALPDEVLAAVALLKNELTDLTSHFERAIAEDATTLTATHEQLKGLSEEFIAQLKQTPDGFYILGHDYPTYFTVMPNCSVAETRKRLYTIFSNRAYPANDITLKNIIAKRDELARLLGYADFAHLDLADQMVKTPERAEAFLQDVRKKALEKVEQEITQLTAQLPESVELTAQGTLNPWDVAYLENEYKKSHFNIDEQLIADYFPIENTIKELLDIYRQFFAIEFEEVAIQGAWNNDVTAVRVLRKDTQELLGTLFLDLYPRPNKYSHAAHTTIIPATFTLDGTRIPDISIVIANFPHATDSKPAVLTRDFVNTFFHEFGHALHAILGATSIASLSGTATKTDFVELPSQMLEEWLTNKDILKKISKHYLTGQPLDDATIDSIVAVKNLFSGYWLTRQIYLSTLSLRYFGAGTQKDPYEIARHEYGVMQPFLNFYSDNHGYASFGHLAGYAAKYYGYLWSKVFALDIFAEIKKHGLLNPEIGQRYVQEVLSKGGAQDPNELLRAFLGRDPNSKAFFEDMGL